MQKNRTPAAGRLKVPLYVMLPPVERERLEAFADRVGRPFSWVVRDALTVYMAAAEADADTMARLRAAVETPGVDLSKAGRTEQDKPGRPRRKLNVR